MLSIMDRCFVLKWKNVISTVQSCQSSCGESYDVLISSSDSHLAKLFRFYEDHFYMHSNEGILIKCFDRNFFCNKSCTITKISLNWPLMSQELSDTGRFFKSSVMFFGMTVFLSAVLFSPLASSNFCGVFCYITGDKATRCYHYQSLRNKTVQLLHLNK